MIIYALAIYVHPCTHQHIRSDNSKNDCEISILIYK